jgi:integrase/recombinase XerD
MKDGKAKVPSAEERAHLFDTILVTRYPERNLAMFMLSYGMGLRVSEIASLNIEDVLTDDGLIRSDFALKKANCKGNKSREVYLSNPLVAKALLDYIVSLRSRGDIYLEAPLFLSQRGNRFTRNQIQAVFAAIYKRAGLTGCKSHSGRRSFATRLLLNGTDIVSVKALMGHASIRETADYADTSPDALRKAAQDAL